VSWPNEDFVYVKSSLCHKVLVRPQLFGNEYGEYSLTVAAWVHVTLTGCLDSLQSSQMRASLLIF